MTNAKRIVDRGGQRRAGHARRPAFAALRQRALGHNGRWHDDNGWHRASWTPATANATTTTTATSTGRRRWSTERRTTTATTAAGDLRQFAGLHDPHSVVERHDGKRRAAMPAVSLCTPRALAGWIKSQRLP